jgi:hypothetical protein
MACLCRGRRENCHKHKMTAVHKPPDVTGTLVHPAVARVGGIKGRPNRELSSSKTHFSLLRTSLGGSLFKREKNPTALLSSDESDRAFFANYISCVLDGRAEEVSDTRCNGHRDQSPKDNPGGADNHRCTACPRCESAEKEKKHQRRYHHGWNDRV